MRELVQQFLGCQDKQQGMKDLAKQLLERADTLSWLQYKSNAQETDWIIQAKYFRASALLLLGEAHNAAVTLLSGASATDHKWASQIAENIQQLQRGV